MSGVSFLSNLYWVFWLVGIIYIGGPIAIYFTQKTNADPQFQVINVEEVPAEIATAISKAWAVLEPAGFELLAYIKIPNMVSSFCPILAYFVNPHTLDKALFTSIYGSQQGVVQLKLVYIEFRARFDDESSLATNNNGQLGSYKASLQSRTFRFPSVTDVGYLYNLHHALIDKYASGRTKVLPAAGEEISFLKASEIRACERQVEFGRLKFDSKLNIFRPTLVGAFLMAWGLLWPMKAIRRYRRDRQARELLSTLNVSSTSVPLQQTSGRSSSPP